MQNEKSKLMEPIVIKKEMVGGGKLIYEMYKTELSFEGHLTCVYGVGVTSTLFTEKESCMIRDVSSNFEKVDTLFELLVTNVVLPCTLKDIVSDYLE